MKKCACGCNQYLLNEKNTFIRGHSNRVQSIKDKKKQASIQKYGVANPSQSLDVKNKKKETYLKHYNVPHYMKSQKGKDQVKQTVLQKYGVTNIAQYEPVKQIIQEKWQLNKKMILQNRKITYKKNFYKKIFETNRLQNKFKPLFSEQEYIDVNHIYKFQCLKCGSICESNLDDGRIPRCFKCNPLITTNGQSIIENEIEQFIKKYCQNVIVHDRTIIHPQELDFIIPEKKIAIEVDSLYWHSEKNGKSKFYHKIKTELCQQKGYRLIHIFDDEWVHKKPIVKARLKHIFHVLKYKIYARKCFIRPIETSIKNKFLNKYHIQDADKGLIKLGAFYKNRLIAVMTFSKLRKALGYNHQEGCWELTRFCMVRGFIISGIANKLFKYFIFNYKPGLVVSYADVRWNTGQVYLNLGFQLDHISKPNYWYTKNYDYRFHRFNFRKQRLLKLFRQSNSSNSEWEIMVKNGYDRVWDCGNYVYKLINNYNDTC